MRTVQDVLYGVAGQALVFDAPEGRPSSVTEVTVSTWDAGDDDTVDATTGSPAVESTPNTTTDAAAGPAETNPRRVPLTATSGAAVGRSYLLTAADGIKEWVDVREVDSGDSVQARGPLHNAFASGSTFQTTRISVALDATWVADEANVLAEPGPNPMYRVRWVYVVAGVTCVADTYFNLVRYGARYGVLPGDIETIYPSWLDALPPNHRADQGRALIAEAYRAVKLDLHQVELDDASVAQAEVVDELVRFKAIELAEWWRYLGSPNLDEGRHQSAERKYAARLEQLVRLTTKVPIRDTTGAATRVVSLGLSRR